MTEAEVPSGNSRAVKKLGGLDCVPEMWKKMLKVDEWCTKIADKVADYEDKEDEELTGEYFDLLSDHPHFGTHSYSCLLLREECSGMAKRLPITFSLSISSLAMEIQDPGTPANDTVGSFMYEEVLKVEQQMDYVSILLGHEV